MSALSGGHLAVDFASGAVPAMLPLFKDRFGLSYALTAAIMLCATAASSLVQPLFGLFSDRRGALWLLPAGVGIAGIGTGLAAVTHVYGLMLVCVFLTGLGVAAFHPEGAKFASYASGHKRASGMALFNIGGNMGYALGPIVIAPLIYWRGLSSAAIVAVPISIGAFAIWRTLPYLRGIVPERSTRGARDDVEDHRALAVLLTIVVLRSVAFFGLLTFAPLYLRSGAVSGQWHGYSLSHWVLPLILSAGAIGTLTLGPVADRIGLPRTLLLTQMLIPPLIVVFILRGGVVGIVALMGVAVCVVGTYGVTMVLSQQYLPRHVALASGLNVGLAVGLGGLAAVCLGLVADAIDLRTALFVSAGAPVLGVLLCLLLPTPAPPHRLAVESVAP
jgi:FSR family fosmidomycin resistance protein-like MFS transporter